MTRTAVVVAVGESWIDLVTLDETEKAHDEHCAASGKGCGCRVSGRPFRAAPPKDIRVQVGNKVEVSASNGRAALASLMLFGLPLAGAAAVWTAMERWLPQSTDSIRTALVAGLLLTTGLAVALGKKKERKAELPIITAVLNASS